MQKMKPLVLRKHEFRCWENWKLKGFAWIFWSTRSLMQARKSLIFLFETLSSTFVFWLGPGWMILNLLRLKPKCLKTERDQFKSTFWKIDPARNQELTIFPLNKHIWGVSLILGKQEFEYWVTTKYVFLWTSLTIKILMQGIEARPFTLNSHVVMTCFWLRFKRRKSNL